jgi:hypothetical protein
MRVSMMVVGLAALCAFSGPTLEYRLPHGSLWPKNRIGLTASDHPVDSNAGGEGQEEGEQLRRMGVPIIRSVAESSRLDI